MPANWAMGSRWISGSAALVAGALLTASIVAVAAPAQAPLAVVESTADRQQRTGAAARVPASPKGPFTFLMKDKQGTPARWNPCEPITWQWQSATSRQLTLAQQAFQKVSQATGMEFIQRDSGANIAVAYSQLERGVLGYGSFYADPLRSVNGVDRDFIARSGTLHIDRRANALTDDEFLNLLMHEIGHIVGLGHVRAASEVMYHRVQDRTEWGAGDLAGLAQLGSAAGCLTR